MAAEVVSGNRRAGLFAAGGVLLFLGMGVAIVLNILLHQLATPTSCLNIAGILTICPNWGWGATIVVCLGVFTSIVGVGLLMLGMQLPPAPLRLFDTEGRGPPDPSDP
jgi:hypothetical protein